MKKEKIVIDIKNSAKIKSFNKNNINNKFLKCLNNKTINRYLESKKKYTKRDCIKFFKERETRGDYYFSLNIKKKNFISVGTATLTKPYKRTTKLGFMVYDKNFLGSIHIRYIFNAILQFAYTKLNVSKILAGTDVNNRSAQHMLLYNNFKLKKKTKKYFYFYLSRNKFKNIIL